MPSMTIREPGLSNSMAPLPDQAETAHGVAGW
jgi:hypothetical protein